MLQQTSLLNVMWGMWPDSIHLNFDLTSDHGPLLIWQEQFNYIFHLLAWHYDWMLFFVEGICFPCSHLLIFHQFIFIFDFWPLTLCYFCFRESPGSPFEVYMEVVHSGTAGSGESYHTNNKLKFQKYNILLKICKLPTHTSSECSDPF